MRQTDSSPPTDLKPASGRIEQGAHWYPVRVHFEDTDVGGIVYYANYLRFIERARSDLLHLLGIDQRAALESGVGVYAVAEVSVRYRAPARLNDELLVETRPTTIRGATVSMEQRVFRGDTLLIEADVTAAFLSPEGRPRRQLAEWVERFRLL